MGSVRGGKRIVHIEIAHFGQFGGEECVVGLFTLVKAGVFQQQHIAITQCGDGVCGLRPTQSGAKLTCLTQGRRQCVCYRGQGQCRVGFAAGPTKMRQQNDFAPALVRSVMVGKDGPNTGVVGDLRGPDAA
jgi:hypothetical protein